MAVSIRPMQLSAPSPDRIFTSEGRCRGMWRVLSVVEQMSKSLNDATRYLELALRAMEDEMSALQTRLHADAASMRSGIQSVVVTDDDRATLLATLDRVEQTADSVAAFAHRRDGDQSTPT